MKIRIISAKITSFGECHRSESKNDINIYLLNQWKTKEGNNREKTKESISKVIAFFKFKIILLFFFFIQIFKNTFQFFFFFFFFLLCQLRTVNV